MKFVKPIAKLGDVIIVATSKDKFLQTTVRESCYRKEFEDKNGSWSYWVDIEKYVDDDFRRGLHFIEMIGQHRIKANLTTGEYFHKLTK